MSSETAPPIDSKQVDSTHITVSPSSVRVWRGYRADPISADKFREKLGDVFIPGTVQIMGKMGLTAYLPSLLPESSLNIPNEIAIVFYKTKETYYKTFDATAGRLYGLLHQSIFSKSQSKSGFPILLEDAIEFDQAYFLIDKNIDWYHGDTTVYVGTRNESQDIESYKDDVLEVLKTVQNSPDGQRDGVITCVNQDYVVYWEHWHNKNGQNKDTINQLSKVTRAIVNKPSTNVIVSADFTAPYEGIALKGEDSLNILFKRL